MARYPTRRRGGFTLLEVMVALAILVVALVALVESQSTGAEITLEAEQYMTATHLAQEKLVEVRLYLEKEGFGTDDTYEEGDFDDFGDEVLDIEFKDLKEYHWEWLISEVDMEQFGDLLAMLDTFTADQEEAVSDREGTEGAISEGLPDLTSFGISNETIGMQIARYVREVRVRVWWGEDSDLAEERGHEVIITTHAVNPSGDMMNSTGAMGAGAGFAGGFGGPGGRVPGMPGANPGGLSGGAVRTPTGVNGGAASRPSAAGGRTSGSRGGSRTSKGRGGRRGGR